MLKPGDKVTPLKDIYTPIFTLKADEVYKVHSIINDSYYKAIGDYEVIIDVEGIPDKLHVMRREVAKVKHTVVD